VTLSNGATLHLLVALSIVLAAAHAGGYLFLRLRQPRVAGEIAAGLVLGPTVLGLLRPDLARELVSGHPSTAVVLGAIYQLGQLLLMYCAGATLQSHRRRGELRTISLIALFGNALPFVAGAVFLLILQPHGLLGTAGNETSFLLVFACGIAVTSIPVISRILADLGLMRTSLARVVLSVALLDDIVLYVILSIALGLASPANADGFTLPALLSVKRGSIASDAYYVGASVALFAVPLTLGRSFVERAGGIRINVLGRSNALAFQVVFMMTMTSLALFLGISPIFGAFIAGILAGTLARTDGKDNATSVDAVRAQASIQRFSFGFFVPIYFAVVGLKLDLIHAFDAAFFVVLFAYACTVKAASVYLAARLAREPRGRALNLAVALNARGGPGIVLASVALDARVISERFYVDLVLLALVTSMIAGAWLGRVVRRSTTQEIEATSAPAIPQATVA
jgi:Kef-type K+ transport system membrane component KefB